MNGFRSLEIKDHIKINQRLKEADFMKHYTSSELVFPNLFAWKDSEDIQIMWMDQFGLLLCHFDSNFVFLPPIASNTSSFIQGILHIQKHYPTIPINGLTSSMIELLLNVEGLILEDDRLGEYIYLAQDLIELKGTKFHRKRNQLSQFKKKYAYAFRTYQPSDQSQVLSLFDRYLSQGGTNSDIKAILNAIHYQNDLDYWIDLLIIDQIVVALSVSVLSAFDHGVILFEKADIHYSGVYAAICQMVVEKHFSNHHLITRQEDLGIPALRKAKLAYHPLYKDKKYQLNFNPILKKMHALYLKSFLDPKAYIDQFFLYESKLEHQMFIQQNDTLISGQHLIKKRLMIEAKEFDTFMIVATATDPSYRNQGYMRQLMQQTLSYLANNNQSMVILYPENPLVYEKVGFIALESINQLDPTGIQKACDLEVTIDSGLLLFLYQTYMKDKKAYSIRDTAWYDQKIQHLYLADTAFYLIKDEHETIGYALISPYEIEEWILLKKIIPILDSLNTSSFNFQNQRKTDLNVMARISDPLLFLREFSYLIDIKEDVHLTIKDDLLQKNTSVIIKKSFDQILINPTHEIGVSVKVQTLMNMVFHSTVYEGIQLSKNNIQWAVFDRY